MDFRPCCGFFETFAAILIRFQQKFAFSGNSRNPNLGVFQQNKPFHDIRYKGHFIEAARN